MWDAGAEVEGCAEVTEDLAGEVEGYGGVFDLLVVVVVVVMVVLVGMGMGGLARDPPAEDASCDDKSEGRHVEKDGF